MWYINDRDMSESTLQIGIFHRTEDCVSSKGHFAMPGAGRAPALNVSSPRYSTTKSRVRAGYLLNIVARDASRFVTNLIRRKKEREKELNIISRKDIKP